MPLEEVEEIMQKYKENEEQIEKLLAEREIEEMNQNKEDIHNLREFLNTHNDAQKRNHIMLRELDEVKACLRSRAIFSPMENKWESICKHYISEPSLIVTRWKCDLP